MTLLQTLNGWGHDTSVTVLLDSCGYEAIQAPTPSTLPNMTAFGQQYQTGSFPFCYPNITPMYYSSFHFLFQYPNITPFRDCGGGMEFGTGFRHFVGLQKANTRCRTLSRAANCRTVLVTRWQGNASICAKEVRAEMRELIAEPVDKLKTCSFCSHFVRS